jgi:hypothetical protein
MKLKRATSSKPKPKLSFSVDRSEFEISSDWVQAVMAQPSLPRSEGPFFSPPINNATDTLSATGESAATEALNPPVALNAPVDKDTTGANSAPVATIEKAPEIAVATDDKNATVANNATRRPAAGSSPNPPAMNGATVVNNASDRIWKKRPLRRITDGLTPGQFAVYSLMFSNGESGQGGERLYRGGYADLGRLTGLSKRGIQNVVADLQQKTAIQLHTLPGHHRSQTSAYLVPSPEAVLAGWLARGWKFSEGKSKRLVNGATVAENAAPEAK